jgi:plastocyanin
MIQELWTELLHFIETLVSPDWGSLIALIPLILAGLVVVFLVWIVVRFMRAGPTRRGPGRVPPATPKGIHMPGPSWAPLIGGIGTAALLFGLVFGGLLIAIGVVLLVIALLYWGREFMREYDVAEGTSPQLPEVVHAGPPPGVHMPGPSFRPLIASIAMTVLFYGLVFGGPLLIAGLIMLAISLLQWLMDFRREYRDVELADEIGHLPPAKSPGYPRATFAAFAVLLIGGLILQTGLLPPRSAVGGSDGGETPSGSPGTSPGASGEPASPPPPPGQGGDAEVSALNIAFEQTEITVPAGRAFTLRFLNKDAGVPHNVEIKDAGGAVLFLGEIFPGVADMIYDVPALAAGSYPFVCTVHPNMTGTLTAQ